MFPPAGHRHAGQPGVVRGMRLNADLAAPPTSQGASNEGKSAGITSLSSLLAVLIVDVMMAWRRLRGAAHWVPDATTVMETWALKSSLPSSRRLMGMAALGLRRWVVQVEGPDVHRRLGRFQVQKQSVKTAECVHF